MENTTGMSLFASGYLEYPQFLSLAPPALTPKAQICIQCETEQPATISDQLAVTAVSQN